MASPRQYQFPYQQRLEFTPEPMVVAEYSRAAGFDDGGSSIYAGTMTTRSSSGDSDSLKSPPDSECHSSSSPFAFNSTSYFPLFPGFMASVDRVASWRMSSQQGGGLGGEFLADAQASWNKDKMVNLFVVKLIPLAGPLSRSVCFCDLLIGLGIYLFYDA